MQIIPRKFEVSSSSGAGVIVIADLPVANVIALLYSTDPSRGELSRAAAGSAALTKSCSCSSALHEHKNF